jgi:septum site-determining protein MinC
MENYITINQKKDEVIIKIKENAEYEDVIKQMKGKVAELEKLYKGENIPIYVTGKTLKNKEIEEIQNIIKEKIDVNVEFDSPKVLGLHGIRKTFEREIQSSETKFYRGSLRSGQRIESEGSYVILGDVNAGAEVIAGENIIVLGSLRGLAHAGAKGNMKAIIAAAEIDAPQVRIANIVKEREKTEEPERRKTYAYIEEKDIILE